MFMLRMRGFKFREIAEQLGITLSTVQRRMAQGEREWGFPDVNTMRRDMTVQIDEAIIAMSPGIRAGNARIIEVFAKLLERKAKLYGLDAPTRVAIETTVPTGSVDEELAMLARELGLGAIDGAVVAGSVTDEDSP